MYDYDAVVMYQHSEDDDVYRQCICDTFKIKDYDHALIMTTIKELYSKYKNCKDFQILLTYARKFDEESFYAFMYLFSWDYFEQLHKCLYELSKTGSISPELLQPFTEYKDDNSRNCTHTVS